MSVKDYATAKGLSRSAIYNQISAGKLEKRKIGSQVFVRPLI